MKETNRTKYSSSSSLLPPWRGPLYGPGLKNGENPSSADDDLKQKSIPEGGDDNRLSTTANPPSANSLVVPESTPSRGRDPDSEAKARARQRNGAISAAVDHSQPHAPIHSGDLGIRGKRPSLRSDTNAGIKFRAKAEAMSPAGMRVLNPAAVSVDNNEASRLSRKLSGGTKAGAATASATSGRSVDKVRLAPESDRDSVSSHMPVSVSTATTSATSGRSTGKVRLASELDRESVSSHIPVSMTTTTTADVSDEDGPNFSNENRSGEGNCYAEANDEEDPDMSNEDRESAHTEAVQAALGALRWREGSLIEAEIAPDLEATVSDAVRRAVETLRNQLRPQELQVSEPQQANVATAFAEEDVDDASEVEDKLCGAPRKLCCGLIAFVVAVAIASFTTAGVLLSTDVDNTSTREISTPTGSPSSIPTSSPLSHIELLANVLQLDANTFDLNKTTTPQYSALEWLAYGDPRKMTVEDDSTELLERFSLATLYYSTKGFNWGNAFRWLSGSSHCDWNLIDCENGRVVELYFSQNLLSGTLPPEIGNFRGLRGLFLGDNLIEGSIPTEVGRLTFATTLQLFKNSIVGTLPTEIGNLSRLGSFSISQNSALVGLVPSEIGLLTSLTFLQLWGNFFDGELPIEITRLRKMNALGLSGNLFEGTIHTELAMMTSLSKLQLFDNRFEGPIPSELGLLSDTLSDLGLSQNKLSGLVPTELGALSRMSVLTFFSNGLQGTLPKELGNLSRLTLLSVRDNPDMVGSIPTELGRLSLLTTLSLAVCGLTGTVPSELGALTQLSLLTLYSNRLQSTLPTELANLSLLTYLDVGENTDLIGSIPTELGSLSLLNYLSLSGCSLNGTIPSELGDLSLLTSLGASGNQLVGTIPSEIGNLQQLTVLSLFGNTGLTGTVPTEFGQLLWILTAYFHSTSLTGGLDDLVFCEISGSAGFQLWSDCGGVVPEITCACCNVCCDTDGANCVEGIDLKTVGSSQGLTRPNFFGRSTAGRWTPND
eukprot:scaffold25064_cov113-Cylindrotheca_fusiformis.AAC.1